MSDGLANIVRAAMTQTKNAFSNMPASVDGLKMLAGHMDKIRDANLEHHIELTRIAKQKGVQVICYGEVFTGPYFAHSRDEDLWKELAEEAVKKVVAEQKVVYGVTTGFGANLVEKVVKDGKVVVDKVN